METDPLRTGHVAPAYTLTDDRFPVCVVGIVHNLKSEVLLIKNNKPGRGWELPGGKKKRGESWRDAVRRELEEEAGMTDIAWSDENPVVIDGWPTSSAGYESIVILVEGAVLSDVQPMAGSDAAEARWCPIDQIPWDDLSKIGSAEELKTWVRWRGGPVPETTNEASVCSAGPDGKGDA